MKKVAVYFLDPAEQGYPLNKNDYFRAYIELSDEVTRQGGEFFIVRSQQTYQGGGKFSTSWQLKSGAIVETGPVEVDVIYDKGGFIVDDTTVPILNPRELDEICTNKWLTYQEFSKYCPTTLVSHSLDELIENIQKIITDIVVIKPIGGEEGTDVFIGNKNEVSAIAKEQALSYPMLVQEFIDSSNGIPGIVDGIHDFRIVVLNGEFAYSYVRTPPKDSLKANVALGGTMKIIKRQQIPEPFLEVLRHVDTKMSHIKPRLYGIDLALTPNGPRIIELNSKVGLLENAAGEVYKGFKEKVVTVLLEMAE